MVRQRFNKLRLSTSVGASEEAIAARYAAAMMEYQVYNTAFWDAIEPSLRFEGAYEPMDRLQKQEFMNNDLRDGVGLYNYVRELTSANPIEKQIEAMQALAAHGKLPWFKLGSSRPTYQRHTNGLLTKWFDVQRPDATADVLDFRTRLIASCGARASIALTPGYGWVQDSPMPPAEATQASTGQQVIAKQAAELRQMQEQLEQAQMQIRAQESALRAAQELAPTPPAAPRTREPAEHLRPIQPVTPVVSSALTALHAATPISSLGRILTPVPEELLVSTRGESKSKGNLQIQSVSYTEAFARGVAYQAQAHMEMERRIVELQGKLKLRTWSWPLAYLLKLPVTMTQAMLAAIKALQVSTTGSAEKTLLWGIILALTIDKFGMKLTPAIRTVL